MKKTLIKTLFLFIAIWLTPLKNSWSAPQLPENVLLRDSEIEQGLIDFLTPIFQIAHLDPSRIKIFLFNSQEVNAAAGLDYSILVNTGLITKTQHVGQLLGVLAHETGHIAGRHNERILATIRQAQIPALASLLLSAAASIAAKRPEIMMVGNAGMDMVENTVLSYQRTHEASADQAAFKYFEKLGWPPQGFYEFMKILYQQEMLSEQHQFAYKRTHPFMIERLRLVERHVESSPNKNKTINQNYVKKFQRMKVKIEAFTDFPDKVLQKYATHDQSLVARYARAIAYHRKSDTEKALKEIDSLLTEYPNDPYFHELKGQIFFETGKLNLAYEAYNKAVYLLPKNGLLKVNLAHIMIELNSPLYNKEALEILSSAEKQENESPWFWRLYATAYGRMGQKGMTTLMLAEEALSSGDVARAHQLAAKAIKELKAENATARQRAKDIQSTEIPNNP